VTGLRQGDVAETVLLCGDPARVGALSAGWSDVRTVCAIREYRVATGRFEGQRLSAASTGVGAPGAAILLEELANVGTRCWLRVGNSGGLTEDLALGDLVITTAAVRDDGTTRAYVRPEYPAAADWRVVGALVEAARARGVRWHAGVTWSLDAFYARNAALGPDGGLRSMSHAGFEPAALAPTLREMQAAGVLNCEMEAGVVLTLAGLFGLRAGCICVVSDRTPWPGPAELDLDRNMEACIAVALDAARRLAGTGDAA
jgi:uridine phosphorylase